MKALRRMTKLLSPSATASKNISMTSFNTLIKRLRDMHVHVLDMTKVVYMQFASVQAKRTVLLTN